VSYDGLGPQELSQRLEAPSLLSLRKVTSTLDVIHELAREGAPGGTVVLANEQVAGRGRMGRTWRSPPDTGIWMAYLVRPHGELEGGVLAIRVGLALTAVLREIGAEAYLKWPNDVVVRDRKVAGVLCEARWQGSALQWIAVGIGINVRGDLADVVDGAITLESVCLGVRRLDVLERLVPRLHALSQTAELDDEEQAAYRERDWLMNRALSEPALGLARGIDRDGALLVETPRGLERCIGGTVVPA